MNEGPVAWMSKKQNVNALPTLESKYAATAAVQKIIWMRNLIATIKGLSNITKVYIVARNISITNGISSRRRSKAEESKWNIFHQNVNWLAH